MVRLEPTSVPGRPTVEWNLDLKDLPMRKPLAEGKKSPAPTAIDDLQREMDELQELRKAVAEAERSTLDRKQGLLARQRSGNPRAAYPS